jgi:Protein of unknown function (DUF4435)
LKRYVDAYSIANAVRMVRTSNKASAAVLVEGDKDVRLYTNLFDPRFCFVTPASTKMNAVSALRLLRKGSVKGVLAIIDSDFSTIVGPAWDDPDILTTETHDLEGILLRSPALEKLLVEHGVRMPLGTALRSKLLSATRQLGYLRLASERGSHVINFEAFDFGTFIDPMAIDCDLRRMTAEAVLKSTNSRFSASEMMEAIKDLDDSTHDPWIISSGHDMTSTLALVLAAQSGKTIPSYTVERQLRLAYEKAYFRDCALRRKIAEWETRNLPFRVL